MAHHDEWAATLRNAEFTNNLQIKYRIAGSLIFFAILFASLYFPLMATPMMAFNIVFISLVWVIDRRISLVTRHVVRRGMEIEKTHMRSKGVFHTVKSIRPGWLMKNITTLYYTVLVVFSFLFTWYSMILRHSSFMDAFYIMAVVYFAIYAYWLKQVEKIESI